MCACDLRNGDRRCSRQKQGSEFEGLAHKLNCKIVKPEKVDCRQLETISARIINSMKVSGCPPGLAFR